MCVNHKRLLIKVKNEEVVELCKTDGQLEKLIKVIGDLEITLRKNYYQALIKAIIGQQLSVKVADTIYSRFLYLLNNDITPISVINVDDEALRSIGISKQKTLYIRDLTQKIYSREVSFEKIEELSNNEIIKMLTNIKGIGIWTAQMFLIFSLGRMDVLPLDDVGVHRGFRWLYSFDKEINIRTKLEQKSLIWGENSTIACLYLWEAVNRDFINYNSVEELYS